MPETKTQSAPYKAILLCKDIHDANNYNHDVLVHNTVDGVRRMPFGQYLAAISKPHDGAYELVSVYPEKIKDGGTALNDLEYLKRTIKGDGYNTLATDARVYMAFRNVWAAATGQIMSI